MLYQVSMLKFEKATVSFLDEIGWLYVGYHSFKVVSLKDNETIYYEEEPFGRKHNQISNIVFSHTKNIAILISYKGDFCIYAVDYKSQSVVKRCSYTQKGNFYCSDVGPIWIEKDCITITIEDKEKTFFRSIFFNGKIIDSDFEPFIHGLSGRSSFNDLLFKKDGKEKIYLGNREYKNFICNYFKDDDICENFNNSNLSVFTDEEFSKKLLAFYAKNELMYYDYSSECTFFKKYIKEWDESGAFDIFSKLINNQVTTIEIKRQKNNFVEDFSNIVIPYISGYVFDNGKKRIVQLFNETFGIENRLLGLSSYSTSFISFVSEKKSIVVIPIENN